MKRLPLIRHLRYYAWAIYYAWTMRELEEWRPSREHLRKIWEGKDKP